MTPTYITTENLNHFIDLALAEDIGSGDHTTLAVIPEEAENEAELKIKAEGVLAGIEFAKFYWKKLDPSLSVEYFHKDGDRVSFGDVAFIVRGSARSILTGERLLLNCMQRMSGIATKTKGISDLLRGAKAKILDTRKTTPNFRMMEKWAVFIGGGKNHRFGLYDQILLKDNHIDMAGGIEKALKSTAEYLKLHNLDLKVEIETRSLHEVKQVIKEGSADIIMLDNMIPSVMKEAVALIDGKFITEASGGVTELNINEVADAGIDYISVGALTHSYESLDMSLKAVKHKII